MNGADQAVGRHAGSQRVPFAAWKVNVMDRGGGVSLAALRLGGAGISR